MPVFTRVYSGATDSTTNKKIKAAVVILTGNKKCVAIPVPNTGYVNRLVVKPTAGTNVTFTVDLLFSKIPFPVGEYITATAALADVELYQVIAQAAGTSGNALRAIQTEQGFPYCNVDGTPTLNERFLYL